MSQPPSTPAREVPVPNTPIELCQFLKYAGVAASGGQAKVAITEGRVQVNGSPEGRKRRKLVLGDRVTLGADTLVVAG
jgi:ribosome-associated protein